MCKCSELRFVNDDTDGTHGELRCVADLLCRRRAICAQLS